MEHSTFGQRVAQARRELSVRRQRDIRPADLAELLGVAPQTVYNWEGDRKRPTAETVAQLAVILGVTPGWLDYGQEPKHPADPPAVPPADPVKDAATFEAWTQRGKEIAAERDATARPASKRVVGLRPTTPTRRGKPRK